MFMIRSLVVLTFALLAPNVKEYISYITKYSYLYHIVHVYNMKYGFEICLDNFRERFCCAFVVWMKGPPHRPDDRAPEECRWLALKRKKKSGLIMRRGQLGPGPTKGMSFSGELAATGGFLSASIKFARSIPSLNFQKLSSDCDKAVWHWIVLGPMGQAKLELYKC